MAPNNYNQLPKYRRGETLLEVLIALVVLIIGSVTATSLILTSIKANLYNKDALQALNLAQEGIEYMRNLRDTNWIRFSANRQGCWNVKPGAATCAGNLLAEALPSDSGYALGQKIGIRIATKLDLADGVVADEEQYRLHYYDLDPTVDSDDWDRPDSLAREADDYDYIASGNPPPAAVASSKFYRSINIDYKTITAAPPWTIANTNNPAVADLMMVSSKVQWKDGGTVHQVVLSSALTRYR